MATERWISAQRTAQDDEPASDLSPLRPNSFHEYVGQRELIERLRITVQASREREEAMGPVLLHGPPGLGKTTMAHVIAHEMGANVHVTSGPALTKGTDLAGALTKLRANDVLFIDEIHRMPVHVEEFIYPAMEDGRIDVAVDAGIHARTVSIRLKPFTLIGATTRAGLLSAPLRSRFDLSHHLRFYPWDDLLAILRRSCGVLSLEYDEPALETIARRSRGTPRIANRLLRRVRDYAQVRSSGRIDGQSVDEALALEGVDAMGLDELDRMYLKTIAGVYQGGPVGVEAIAATLSVDVGTLEDVVEPYLLQSTFLARTRRGRQLTATGASHVGYSLAHVPGVSEADGLPEDSTA